MAKNRKFVVKATSERWEAGEKFDEEGAFETCRFHDEDSGFVIGQFRTKSGDAIVCKGTVPGFVIGAPYHIVGKVIDDKNWGIQVNISSAAASKPSTSSELVAFLGSGSVPGIGPVTARRIVKTFGKDVLDVIENHPERLVEVPGIGAKTVKKIIKVLPSVLKYREIIGYFADLGVSVRTINRLIDEYGSRTREVIEKNPYILCRVRGFAFTRADSIAMRMGISKYDPNRLYAGILATLRWMCDNNGHTLVPRQMLLEESLNKLGIDDIGRLDDAMDRLTDDGKIVTDELGCHLKYLFNAEKTIKNCLARSVDDDNLLSGRRVRELIETCLARSGMELTDEQTEAVRKVFVKKVSVMTGGAGVGKSFTCKTVVDVAKEAGLTVCLMAPTGRAAKHLSDVCGAPGFTMHRALAIVVKEAQDDDFFADDEAGTIRNKALTEAVNYFNKSDVIIADEASMMDTEMAAILFKACRKKHLMLVGDPNQLPSVGPGRVLGDIMDSSYAQIHGLVTRLTKIFRQEEGSPVIEAANRVIGGESPVFVRGVTFLEADNEHVPEAIENYVVPLLKDNKYAYDEWMVLAPMKKTPYSGVNALNTQLRPFMNPYYRKPANEKLDFLYQKGDLIMQIKNNYDVDIYNGDIGIVQSVDEEGNFEVLFSGDDETVIYEKDEQSQTQLCNAMSIHKSQGGQAQVVVVVLTDSHYAMLNRNLLYTAITRCSDRLVLVGTKHAYAMAASNQKENNRMTGLRGI